MFDALALAHAREDAVEQSVPRAPRHSGLRTRSVRFLARSCSDLLLTWGDFATFLLGRRAWQKSKTYKIKAANLLTQKDLDLCSDLVRLFAVRRSINLLVSLPLLTSATVSVSNRAGRLGSRDRKSVV